MSIQMPPNQESTNNCFPYETFDNYKIKMSRSFTELILQNFVVWLFTK